jgi:hypothetical protein
VIGGFGRSLAALTLLSIADRGVNAQDSVAAKKHVLPLNIAQTQTFQRSYSIVVKSVDSTFVIGQRDVGLVSTTYAGAPAWLLFEKRTGIIPAVESLFVMPNLRPVHWSAVLGAARLGAQFVGDTIYGATSSPTGKRSIVTASRPDLLVSAAMVEAFLPLLPLAIGWSDSAGILAVDLSTTTIVPAEITVIGEEHLSIDGTARRPTWVVAVKTEPRYVLFWIDKETGATLRVQYALPAQGGALLEYRLHPRPSGSATVPPKPCRIRCSIPTRDS